MGTFHYCFVINKIRSVIVVIKCGGIAKYHTQEKVLRTHKKVKDQKRIENNKIKFNNLISKWTYIQMSKV